MACHTNPWQSMVGVARLELTTPRSQSECATNCATPRIISELIERIGNKSNVPAFLYQRKFFLAFYTVSTSRLANARLTRIIKAGVCVLELYS